MRMSAEANIFPCEYGIAIFCDFRDRPQYLSFPAKNHVLQISTMNRHIIIFHIFNIENSGIISAQNQRRIN